MVHALWPVIDTLPAAHGEHADCPAAPENMPGLQGVHVSCPVRANSPAVQGAHAAAEMEPELGLALPRGHNVHSPPPTEKVPGPQMVHATALADEE